LKANGFAIGVNSDMRTKKMKTEHLYERQMASSKKYTYDTI